jgi:hypothetical protein
VRGRRTIPEDEWRYGDRSSAEVRSTLLALTYRFVVAARTCAGVSRIALVGSMLTPKPRPKDVDVLVTIGDEVDMTQLARLGRRLKGTAQGKLNSGADIFLADHGNRYIGRICHFRECHRRVACRARNCGAVEHLNDDLDVIRLAPELTATPPVELWPTVLARVAVPDDVERLLLTPLRTRPDTSA